MWVIKHSRKGWNQQQPKQPQILGSRLRWMHLLLSRGTFFEKAILTSVKGSPTELRLATLRSLRDSVALNLNKNEMFGRIRLKNWMYKFNHDRTCKGQMFSFYSLTHTHTHTDTQCFYTQSSWYSHLPLMLSDATEWCVLRTEVTRPV